MKKNIFALLLTLLLLVPNVTQAETSSATTGVTGGSLDLNNINSSFILPHITIDATDGNYNYSSTSSPFTFNITDSRGTGEGYRLDVSAAPLTEVEPVGGFAIGTTPIQLRSGSLVMKGVENMLGVGSTLSFFERPSLVVTTEAVIDDGTVAFVSANYGNGAGSYDFTFPADFLQVKVHPSDIVIDKVNYPDTPTPYETVITWTLSNTP